MKKLLAVLLLLVVYPAYGQDYTVAPVTPPPLQNIYEQGGTNLALQDDGMAFDVKLGFDFEFYGSIFNSVNISNNGFLTFGGTNSMCCDGQPLPAWGMDNSIIGLWTDLISTNNINPYYKSYAVDGNRVFTVGWYGTLEFYNLEAPNTFEITLYEGSNNILFNYGDVNVFSHTLTAGIQGTNGQYEQIIYGNNANQLDNTAYLFTYLPPEPPPKDPIAPDCSTNPTYINCIIQTISTDTQVLLVDTNDNVIVSEEPTTEVIGGTVDLESLLATNQESTETVEKEKEEDKEKELKDDIQTSVLESVLAATDSINRNTKTSNETVEPTVKNETSSTTEQTVDEIETLVSNQTETIEETNTVETTESTTEEMIMVVQQQVTNEQETTTSDNTTEISEEQYVENINSESVNNSIEVSESVVVANSQIETELDELQNILQNSSEQQKTFTEEEDEFVANTINITGTPNMVTIIQPFNTEMSMADKEVAGAFGKSEDKSDAEKRAEEIVAANAKEQEEINNNYMDADQSGLIGAIAGDTDVTAYRTSNIPDLSSWYKPEDIYKNVVYKDNARGMYFLEKGNTDTYKQMVEEQYK